LGRNARYSFQKIDAEGKYKWEVWKNGLTQEHFFTHFYSDTAGSLGVVPVMEEKFLLWFCIDLDSAEATDKFDAGLRGEFERQGIEFLEELGGDKLERRHIWVRVQSTQKTAKEFLVALLMYVYKYSSPGECFASGEFEEIYGINLPNTIVRIFLGRHLRRGGVRYPLILRNGNYCEDPVEAMKEWLDLSVLTEERMAEILASLQIEPVSTHIKKTFTKSDFKRFVFKPLNLPLYMDDIPELLQPVFRNCPAYSELSKEIVSNGMIQTPGEVHHNCGLAFTGLAAWADNTHLRRGQISLAGKKWNKRIRSEYRWRSDEDHGWDEAFETVKDNHNRVFFSCQAMSDKFGKCGGCKFAGVVSSPKEFIYGQTLDRTFTEFVELTSAEDVRLTVFPEVKEFLHKAIDEERRKAALLATFLGSGKSTLVSEIACELAAKGKSVLIAAPTTDIAREYKERFDACGAHSFILASHRAIFEGKDGKPPISSFPCPEFEEIQRSLRLGVSSSEIKEDICAGCPFADKCYYPTQYEQVMEDHHRIVIVQHAHFTTPEVIYKLMSKKFDLLVIDEMFIDTCYKNIPLIEEETEIIKDFGAGWTESLFEWIKGDRPSGRLSPPEEDLERIQSLVLAAGLSYRIPDLVRFYNQGRRVNKYMGIEVVYDIPNIPVKLFTDATPPEELIKHMTGLDSLHVFGKKQVLDYRRIHPDNKVFQVLDHTGSITSYSNPEVWEQTLLAVGERIELMYEDQRGLISVVRLEDVERVKEFFRNHPEEFPSVLERTDISVLEKGTNKYVDHSFQFILGALYEIPKKTMMRAYKYKTVANYHRKKQNYRTLQNRFPFSVPDGASIEQNWDIRLRRIEPLRDTGTAGVFLYPTIKAPEPTNDWYRYCKQILTAITQQAIRLRFKPDKARHVYILNNMFFPSLLVTDSLTFEEFCRPLP
jgi:hypothetical protein